MRAKRSKKYRKIMSAYNLHFSFREPYQTLCDGDFLRTCHAFHMPIRKFLDNTLMGETRPFVTQCSLAAIMEAHRKKFAKENGSQNDKNGGSGMRGRGDGKPVWLPLPEDVPLRYCKHKDLEGKERGVLSEEECLLDLVSGQVHGNEVPRNKQHYILATAESEEEQRTGKRRRGRDIREQVRMVPGVPVVYVKRSVMILEELSMSSERVIRGVEKEKLKEGLVGAIRGLKRKREDGESDDEKDDSTKRDTGPKIRSSGKAKGPNPLSVKKKKVKAAPSDQNRSGQVEDGDKKTKNRRKRGIKHKADGDTDRGTTGAEIPKATALSADGVDDDT